MCAPNLRSCSAMSLMRTFPTTGSTIAMVLFDASDASVQWLQQFLSASDRSVAYQTQFVFLVETKIDTIVSDEMKGKSEEARRKLGNVQWMLNRSAFKSVVRRCAHLLPTHRCVCTNLTHSVGTPRPHQLLYRRGDR